MKKILFACALVSALLFTSCSAAKLEFMVADLQSECPLEMDEGVIINDVTTDSNDNIIFEVLLEDENIYGLAIADVLAGSYVTEMLEDQFIEFLRDPDPDVREFVRLLKDANYGIILRLSGMETNMSYDIAISPYEI